MGPHSVNPGGATQGQGHWEAGLTGTSSVTIYHSPIQNSLEYERMPGEAQSCIEIYSMVSWVGFIPSGVCCGVTRQLINYNKPLQ